MLTLKRGVFEVLHVGAIVRTSLGSYWDVTTCDAQLLQNFTSWVHCPSRMTFSSLRLAKCHPGLVGQNAQQSAAYRCKKSVPALTPEEQSLSLSKRRSFYVFFLLKTHNGSVMTVLPSAHMFDFISGQTNPIHIQRNFPASSDFVPTYFSCLDTPLWSTNLFYPSKLMGSIPPFASYFLATNSLLFVENVVRRSGCKV